MTTYSADQAAQAVNLLYRAVLGREADAGSLTHAADLLQRGHLGVHDIALGLMTSPEFEGRGPLKALRGRSHEPIFLQTADPYVYQPMLSSTSRTVAAYCNRHDLRCEIFIGVKRGYWPWHATYNRIYMLRELMDRGFRGWAVYLDADAYVADLTFDLKAYLADKNQFALIGALALGHMDPSVENNGPHNLNIGVLLVNLGHPVTASILGEWHEFYESVPEYIVRAAREFDAGMLSDQSMLHEILRRRPEYVRYIHHADWSLMNSPHARFIRQLIRAEFPDFDQRVRALSAAVDRVLTV